MMKTFLIFFVSAVLLAGCTQKGSFNVSGTYKGEEHEYIYVNKVDVNTSERIDSAKIDKKGQFHFTIRNKETDYYQLGFSDSDFITLLATPGEKIKLTFEGSDLFTNYKITGSKGSEQVKTLDSTLFITKTRLDSIRVAYDLAANTADFSVRGPALDKAFSDLVTQQRKYNIAFILENTNSLASIKALYQKIDDEAYVLYDPRDLQFLKIVSDSLKVYYPDSRHTIALDDYFQSELNKFNMNRLTQAALEGPSMVLDPSLIDINGKRVVLSSLEGKYVLLSFWSIQCPDCIAENLLMKDIYKTYKNNGFEIYQISIDVDEAAWRSAVKFDELPWINVREDSTLKISNTTLYNVQNVPANFLYDKSGEIIGKNLLPAALKIKLEQLIGK